MIFQSGHFQEFCEISGWPFSGNLSNFSLAIFKKFVKFQLAIFRSFIEISVWPFSGVSRNFSLAILRSFVITLTVLILNVCKNPLHVYKTGRVALLLHGPLMLADRRI